MSSMSQSRTGRNNSRNGPSQQDGGSILIQTNNFTNLTQMTQQSQLDGQSMLEISKIDSAEMANRRNQSLPQMKILSLGNNSNKMDKVKVDANTGHSQKFSQQNPQPQSSNLLNGSDN